MTVEQIRLIRFLILENHEGVEVELVVHVQVLHHVVGGAWAYV